MFERERGELEVMASFGIEHSGRFREGNCLSGAVVDVVETAKLSLTT